MPATQLQSLLQEDYTYHGANKRMCHNYWSLRTTNALKPILHKGSRHNEKPVRSN